MRVGQSTSCSLPHGAKRAIIAPILMNTEIKLPVSFAIILASVVALTSGCQAVGNEQAQTAALSSFAENQKQYIPLDCSSPPKNPLDGQYNEENASCIEKPFDENLERCLQRSSLPEIGWEKMNEFIVNSSLSERSRARMLTVIETAEEMPALQIFCFKTELKGGMSRSTVQSGTFQSLAAVNCGEDAKDLEVEFHEIVHAVQNYEKFAEAGELLSADEQRPDSPAEKEALYYGFLIRYLARRAGYPDSFAVL